MAEQPLIGKPNLSNPWKIMVVDDEPAAHDMISMALEGIEYNGRPLEFVHMLDVPRASEYLRENDDIAVVMIDIVMRGKPEGLKFAKWIRSDLHNQFVRLIMITGHVGKVPERDVVNHYDINQFLDKRNLHGERLAGAVITALRSYVELTSLFDNRKPLADVIHASGMLYGQHHLTGMLDHVATQLREMTAKALGINSELVRSAALMRDGVGFKIVAGDDLTVGNEDGDQAFQFSDLVEVTFANENDVQLEKFMSAYAETASGRGFVFLLYAPKSLRQLWNPLELYWENVKIAMQQADLTDDLMQEVSAAS